jgi:DNA-binding CsgD family transcriptional regulator
VEPNSRTATEFNDVLASFTLGQYRLRVKQATSTDRTGSLGEFNLDGISYVVIVDPDNWKAVAALTRREREIAFQIARGRGTKQIAYELGISPHTAVTYVNRIRIKLGVRNRPEMVATLLAR